MKLCTENICRSKIYAILAFRKEVVLFVVSGGQRPKPTVYTNFCSCLVCPASGTSWKPICFTFQQWPAPMRSSWASTMCIIISCPRVYSDASRWFIAFVCPSVLVVTFMTPMSLGDALFLSLALFLCRSSTGCPLQPKTYWGLYF